ncbi:MAG TPA: hypothetical protein VNX68_12970 [Nitrosopumilaceae archaeon]|nr:hypothetical protein [Nitrosopumilaceae archaeon]
MAKYSEKAESAGEYREDCQKPQFSFEMHYPGEHVSGMNHGSMTRPATAARAHHHTHAKDRLIEHTMRTERHTVAAPGVNVVEAPGIIGNNGKHSMNFKFPVGTDVKKIVGKEPRKASGRGEFKGGL